MRCRRVVILAGFFAASCKTVSPETPEPQAPIPAVGAPATQTTTPVKPSSSLQTTPHLVTPGPDEVLIRRGSSARCPTAVELDVIERAVHVLGRDTIDLVHEDLTYLKRIMARTDRDGINSCCNQMEQLVQDCEIMNEEKPSAEPSLDTIRKTTLQLCPPG